MHQPSETIRVATLARPLAYVALLVIIAFGSLTMTGCTPKSRTRSGGSDSRTSSSNEHLTQATELLAQSDLLGQETSAAELSFVLNRWNAAASETDDGWKLDPLAERLPRSLRELYPLEELGRGTFEIHDSQWLQENIWLRQLSDWIVRQPSPESLERWIAGREPPLDRDQADQLRAAERLFDWTVRNIQLDDLLPYPEQAVVGPTTAGTGGASEAPKSGGSAMPPYARGLFGPGYLHEPRLTLLIGHGDAWNRARIFTLLARQQQIDVVLLAIDDVKISPRPQPWLPAVLLKDQLYLFDVTLGLPLPAARITPATDATDAADASTSRAAEGVAGVQGIGTFAEYRENPSLLTALDLDAEHPYRVQPADLANVIAMIDAAPAALSRRMHRLERRLTGDLQLNLAVRPSSLADRLRSIPGINRVQLWATPWEAEIFASAVFTIAQQAPTPEIRFWLAEQSLFGSQSPIATGRFRHLQGEFDNTDDRKGAKGHYMQARIPDEVIENLLTDVQAQNRMGLAKDRYESDAAWQSKLIAIQMISRNAKLYASYWLGLIHYESGHYDIAAEWFKTRILELPDDNQWKSGARYNLARCYEKLGDTKAARELYDADDSPQRHGNRLRSRELATGK